MATPRRCELALASRGNLAKHRALSLGALAPGRRACVPVPLSNRLRKSFTDGKALDPVFRCFLYCNLPLQPAQRPADGGAAAIGGRNGCRGANFCGWGCVFLLCRGRRRGATRTAADSPIPIVQRRTDADISIDRRGSSRDCRDGTGAGDFLPARCHSGQLADSSFRIRESGRRRGYGRDDRDRADSPGR